MNSIDLIKDSLFDFLNNQFQIEAGALDKVEFTLNIDDKKQNFGDISTNTAIPMPTTIPILSFIFYLLFTY